MKNEIWTKIGKNFNIPHYTTSVDTLQIKYDKDYTNIYFLCTIMINGSIECFEIVMFALLLIFFYVLLADDVDFFFNFYYGNVYYVLSIKLQQYMPS